MLYKITKNIDRISFHDSQIKNIKFSDNFIVMNVDWAKLANFEEKNVSSLVLGSCVLTLKGIQHSSLEIGENEQKQTVTHFYHSPPPLEEILENSSQNDNEIRFSGFATINKKYQWITWKLNFESFEFAWNKHITLEEWETKTKKRES